MNANIMNTQIFYFIKYDLNSYRRSQKVTYVYFNPNLRSYGQRGTRPLLYSCNRCSEAIS